MADGRHIGKLGVV